MKFFLSISSILVCLCVFSCSKSDSKLAEEIAAADEATIVAYLEDNNLTSQKLDSGLHYIIENEGSGPNPAFNSTVEVIYKGYFPDGEVFDQTPSASTSIFSLSQVIPGWQQGIPLFKKGGTGVLLIPSSLGYGSNPPADIPADQVLIFDIHVIDF